MTPEKYHTLAQEAADHLSTYDPLLSPVIAANGLCTIQPHSDYYQALLSSIIGQQLSVKAAATIRQRLMDLYDGVLPSSEQLLATDVETLRGVGLSRPKIAYMRDLAEHINDRRISFEAIDQLDNDAIIKKLTDVKGIGEWTVHMFLMFAMGRSDVLAHGDLGVRNAAMGLYGLEHAPSPTELLAIAERYQWQPYASFACWYLWRFLDNKPL
jgi:DNA-3-methyladenine glycosylase II